MQTAIDIQEFNDIRKFRRDIEIVFLTEIKLPKCLINIITEYSKIDDKFLDRVSSKYVLSIKTLTPNWVRFGWLNKIIERVFNYKLIYRVRIFSYAHTIYPLKFQINCDDNYCGDLYQCYHSIRINKNMSSIFNYILTGYIQRPNYDYYIKKIGSECGIDEFDHVACELIKYIIRANIWPDYIDIHDTEAEIANGIYKLMFINCELEYLYT